MPNPNQSPSTDNNAEQTEWDSLSEVEFVPFNIPTNGIPKIDLSGAPMGKGRQDKRVDVTDASGMEKRTSNLMLGYNNRGVQIGETYLSIEEFRKKALEYLKQDAKDEVLYFVRTTDGKRFAEPRAVVDDMILAITGAGPEATLSDNSNITNQDARSVQFTGPNSEVQRGAFMLGNNGIQMPNGTYAEAGTVGAVAGQYASAVKKEIPIPPEDTTIPTGDIQTPEADAEEKDLHQATLELAELYAKNRRLIPGAGTKEKFEAARQEYQQLLAEHLASFGQAEYDAGFSTLSSDIQTMASELVSQNLSELAEFAGGDLDHPTKTPEEIEAKREELRRAAEAKMKEKYPDMVEGLEATVTARMVEEYVRTRSELEEATIDALDNGTVCRQAVSKIITNKWVKGGLAVAAAAGLAVTAIGIGHGVADGSLAVSLGYTAGGIAAGAVRGGLSGALMSRQSSNTSAIRGYGGDVESIEDRIKAGEHITTESLAAEAMSDYAAGNQADARSNKVKTAVSTGIGTAVGAAASGIHVDNVVRSSTTERIQTGTVTEQVQTGTTPEQYDVDLTKIDIMRGSGMNEAFADLGGDPSKVDEAIRIAQQFDANYGMVPGSDGVIPGVGGQVGSFAHTYPGTIDTWPEQAREYITQVAQKWAESGLIDVVKTGGEPLFTTVETPIFSTVEKTVINYIPNTFYNVLIQAEAAALAGSIGTI